MEKEALNLKPAVDFIKAIPASTKASIVKKPRDAKWLAISAKRALRPENRVYNVARATEYTTSLPTKDLYSAVKSSPKGTPKRQIVKKWADNYEQGPYGEAAKKLTGSRKAVWAVPAVSTLAGAIVPGAPTGIAVNQAIKRYGMKLQKKASFYTVLGSYGADMLKKGH